MAQCPLPPPGTKYVDGPDVRGTLDILYTCLSVIILSTWNVLHLNVPIRSYARTWMQRLRRNTVTGLTKTFWMLLNIFMPELLVARSLAQRLSARRMNRHVQKFVDEDLVDWSTAHSFLADMRGFEIVFENEVRMSGQIRSKPDRSYGDYHRPKPILKRNAPRSMALIGASLAHLGLTSQWPLNIEPALGGPTTSRSYALVDRADPGHAKVMKMAGTRPASDVESRSAENDNDEDKTIQSCARVLEPHPSICKLKGACVHEKLPPYAMFNGLALCRLALTQCRFQRTAYWLGPIAWAPSAENWSAVTIAAERIEHLDLTPKEYTIVRKNLHAFQGSSWRPNARQLLMARSLKIISALPSVPIEEIDDRSQSDEILKTLSVCQILWLVIQVCGRAAEHLPITLLEIMALALATLALVIYGLLWSKPQDIKTTIKITANRHPSADEIISLALMGMTIATEAAHIRHPISATIEDNGFAGISNPQDRTAYFTGLLIGSSLFGAFHLIPWNFKFPTTTERLLWRASGLITIIMPIIFIPTSMLVAWVMQRRQRGTTRAFLQAFDTGRIVETWLSILYLAARLFSLVECVRSLFYLEPAAFRTSSWDVLPHFG